MAGALPSSEAELYRSRPPTNRPNTFPTDALLGGEKVLLEIRPRFVGLHPVLIYGSLPFVILLLLVLADGIALYGADPGVVGAVGFFVFLALIPILYALSSWRNTAYALTDQRVVAAHGSSYSSAAYDEIERVSMKEGSSKIRFELASPSPPGTVHFARRPRTLLWESVPGAPAVADFAESAVSFYRIRNRQRELRDRLTVASLQGRVVCRYCGGLVDISGVSAENPRCPRCTAPLTLAPTGV